MLDPDIMKKSVIIALFTDDDFFDKFVLKGGTALLIHGINFRASQDIDISMKDDFEIDLEEVRNKLEIALNKTFYVLHYHVIDVKLTEKPNDGRILLSRWGGYKLEFKIVSDENFNKYIQDPSKLSKTAECITKNSNIKTFTVDISKYEYCELKTETEIDKFPIFIYTPMMILLEKLRAICQQHTEYNEIIKTHRPHPRPRDFFDIYTIIEFNPDLKSEILKSDNLEILKNVFYIKKVPLYFLDLIFNYREFHSMEWIKVQSSVNSNVQLESYDFYFDRCIDISNDICERLINLNMMDNIPAIV